MSQILALHSLHLHCLLLGLRRQVPSGALELSNVHVIRDQFLPVPRRRQWRRVLVQDVDLLERQALRLWDAEEREDDASQTRRTPNEEHPGFETSGTWLLVDKVWGYETNLMST